VDGTCTIGLRTYARRRLSAVRGYLLASKDSARQPDRTGLTYSIIEIASELLGERRGRYRLEGRQIGAEYRIYEVARGRQIVNSSKSS